jgi:ankyrin repeat protein
VHAHREDALIWSVKNGFLDIVKLLVEAGSNIHIRHRVSLRLTVDTNNVEMAKYLISKGITKNNNDDYPLKESLRNGYSKLVKLLMENGGDTSLLNEK